MRGLPSVFGLAPLFQLDWEQSLPTWYSSLTLAFSALLLFTIYRTKSASRDDFSRYWLGLAVIFASLSADEASSIHENFEALVRQNVSDLGLAFGQWTLVYAPLVLVFAAVYWSFLK